MERRERTYLVLGGGGFLGINLCRRLVAAGHHVKAFGHRGLFPEAVAGIQFRRGEFADGAALSEVLRGVEVVFHLIHSTVPQSANRDLMRDIHENLVPSVAFLDLARQSGVKRMVFLSSGGTIYGRPQQIPTEETAPTDPITGYGISKLAIEKYLALYEQLHGLHYRILRVANPFGPFQVAAKKQGLIAETISCAVSGRRVEVWGDGSIVRDFIFVEDVVDALEIAASHTGEDRIFNIGTGIGRSVRDVLATVEHSLGTKLDVAWKTGRAVDVPTSVLSVKRAKEKLGWSAKTSFESGVLQTITWWKDNADSIGLHSSQLKKLQDEAAIRAV